MRKFVVPAVLALVVALPGAAFAASTTPAAPAAKASTMAPATQMISGKVRSFDLKAHTLTLADGKTYQLPLNFKDPGIKAGQQVTVHWTHNGSINEATSVSLG